MARAVVAPSPWIVGRSYDRLFLGAAWCVPLLLWLLAVSLPYGFLVAMVLFVLLDNSHQLATLPLTIFDPTTMRRSAPIYLGGALAIGGAAVVISFFPKTPIAQIWASLVVYWGAWHIIRQHYGFLRLYQGRDKPASPLLARAEVWALYAGASFPYFFNLSHDWAADDPIAAMLYRVPVPAWSPWVVLVIFVAAFAVVLSDIASRARARRTLVSRRLLHIVLVVSNFWLGLLILGGDNLLLAVLFITSYHDLQYHAVVWHVGTKRTQATPSAMYPLVRRLFGSTALFGAVVLTAGLAQAFLRNDFQITAPLVPESVVTTAIFALVTSYSYMHYFFDGLMWKLSSDARLRAELGLGSRQQESTG